MTRDLLTDALPTELPRRGLLIVLFSFVAGDRPSAETRHQGVRGISAEARLEFRPLRVRRSAAQGHQEVGVHAAHPDSGKSVQILCFFRIQLFCYLLPKQRFFLFLICALQQMRLLGLFVPPYPAASVCFEPTSVELHQA